MKVGLDIGSTTIKCVVLDDDERIIYSTYERHYSHIVEKSEELLCRVAEEHVPGGQAQLAIFRLGRYGHGGQCGRALRAGGVRDPGSCQ